jgi:hypothetical protein
MANSDADRTCCDALLPLNLHSDLPMLQCMYVCRYIERRATRRVCTYVCIDLQRETEEKARQPEKKN